MNIQKKEYNNWLHALSTRPPNTIEEKDICKVIIININILILININILKIEMENETRII